MKLALIVLAAATIIITSIVAFAFERGTAQEAQALVEKAVDSLNTIGKEKTFNKINNPAGGYTMKDLYVFVYDMNGVVLAHGAQKNLIGKNLSEARDPDGRQWVKERIRLASTKGKGWQNYKFIDPLTNKLIDKKAYIEKCGDMIVGCGIYIEEAQH